MRKMLKTTQTCSDKPAITIHSLDSQVHSIILYSGVSPRGLPSPTLRFDWESNPMSSGRKRNLIHRARIIRWRVRPSSITGISVLLHIASHICFCSEQVTLAQGGQHQALNAVPNHTALTCFLNQWRVLSTTAQSSAGCRRNNWVLSFTECAMQTMPPWGCSVHHLNICTQQSWDFCSPNNKPSW